MSSGKNTIRLSKKGKLGKKVPLKRQARRKPQVPPRQKQKVPKKPSKGGNAGKVAPGAPCIQIVGAFNTGTNLVTRVLKNAFKVQVHNEGHTLFWKHTCLRKHLVRRCHQTSILVVLQYEESGLFSKNG